MGMDWKQALESLALGGEEPQPSVRHADREAEAVVWRKGSRV